MKYKNKKIKEVTTAMIAEYVEKMDYKLPSIDEVYDSIKDANYYQKDNLESAIVIYEKNFNKQHRNNENQGNFDEQLLNDVYYIYTDGSCDNVKTKVGGSSYIIIKDGEIIKMKNKGFYPTTNNRMEMLAIISALNSIPEDSSAIVFTDSKYCIRVFDGLMHEKNQDLIRLYAKVTRTLKRIVFQWVKGHDGNKYNEMADELAFSAYKEMSEKLGMPISKNMLKTH